MLIFYQVMDSGAIRTKQDLQSLLSLPVCQKTTLYALAAHIMSRLAPLLVSWRCLLIGDCVLFMLDLVFPYQSNKLAWGTSPK